MPWPGEIAALATACCWAISAVAFEMAGRRVGSLAVNFLRLAAAIFLLGGWLLVSRGNPLPAGVPPHAAAWLVGSGLVGFVFGDLCLFQAMVVLGSRVSLLIMSLVPPITALLGLVFLGEGLSGWGLVGMFLTLGGVVAVVAERNPGRTDQRYPLSGILLAVCGALGQSVGLLMSRQVMAGVDPFEAALVRVLAGAVGFALVLCLPSLSPSGLVWGRWSAVGRAFRDRTSLACLALGSVFGPFLGVTGSLAAVRYTDAGTASTLMSIVPILLIPPSLWIFKERVSRRAILGSLVAVAGVAAMFR